MTPTWAQYGWYAVAAAAVLLLPGGAALAWMPGAHRKRFDLLALLADAAALSITFSALVGLVLFLTGFHLSGGWVAGIYLLSLVAVAGGLWKRLLFPGWKAVAWNAVPVLLAVLFAAGLVFWRLYQARSLVLPAWVDSVHHTLLVRVILETGTLPRDLTPYLPVPLFYHYAFHFITALFASLAGFAPADAVLWFGQVVNALVALSVYRMAAALFAGYSSGEGRVLRAILAAALVGFVFQMPAYYLSWGRYTLLTGLILLGPAISAAVEYAARGQTAGVAEAGPPPLDSAAGVRLMLLVAGMCLAHYFALLLLGLFLVVFGVFLLVRSVREHSWKVLWSLAAWSAAGVLLALPWVLWLLQNTGEQAGVQVVGLAEGGGAVQPASDYFQYLAYLTGPRYNHIILGFAGVGLFSAIYWPALRPAAVWTVLLMLLALPWGLRIGPFRPDHFVIVYFFPAAIFLAELLVSGAEALSRMLRSTGKLRLWSGRLAIGLAAAVIVVLGIRETRNIVNSVTAFVTPADVRAISWVREHTPPDARFYINSTTWLGSYRGVDGGYWLLPYTGRASMVPPVFYTWGDAQYVSQIHDWAARSGELQTCTPDFWSLVRDANLQYVYLREGIGSLQPAGLADCPRLRKVYEDEGVTIFEILRPG